MAKPDPAPEDPTTGWSDEKILAEFISFAESSADDMGVTGDMCKQARDSLQRLAKGTGSTEADARLVETLVKLNRASERVFNGVRVNTSSDEMIEITRALMGAIEELRHELAAAGSIARNKLKHDINSAQGKAQDALDRIKAHAFRT